jgi:hypothetical protein
VTGAFVGATVTSFSGATTNLTLFDAWRLMASMATPFTRQARQAATLARVPIMWW